LPAGRRRRRGRTLELADDDLRVAVRARAEDGQHRRPQTSEYTPLSVQALVAVVNQALPADVLAVVPGDGAVGAALTSHADVGKIMFTGSTKTGQAIMRTAADSLARITLELGG